MLAPCMKQQVILIFEALMCLSAFNECSIYDELGTKCRRCQSNTFAGCKIVGAKKGNKNKMCVEEI